MVYKFIFYYCDKTLTKNMLGEEKVSLYNSWVVLYQGGNSGQELMAESE